MRKGGRSALGWLWLSVLVLALDQASKHLAAHYLVLGQPVPLLSWFNLNLAYNTGAAFSLLGDASGWQRWFFIAVGLIAAVVIAVWLSRLPAAGWRTAAALALILGGALGNVIDRVLLGHVIDFIQWYYKDWYWPTFNLADSAIDLGAALLILDGLLPRRDRP